jgi:hypothetical protein
LPISNLVVFPQTYWSHQKACITLDIVDCVVDKEIDDIKRQSLDFHVLSICTCYSLEFLPLEGGVENDERGEMAYALIASLISLMKSA